MSFPDSEMLGLCPIPGVSNSSEDSTVNLSTHTLSGQTHGGSRVAKHTYFWVFLFPVLYPQALCCRCQGVISQHYYKRKAWHQWWRSASADTNLKKAHVVRFTLPHDRGHFGPYTWTYPHRNWQIWLVSYGTPRVEDTAFNLSSSAQHSAMWYAPFVWYPL